VSDFGLHIRFQGLPLWVLIPIAALSVYVLWRYRDFLLKVEFPKPFAPLALRAGALFFLILLAAGPVIYMRARRPTPLRAAIVIDRSQSMLLKDGTNTTRWARALAAARIVENELETTASIFTADDELSPVPSIDSTQKLSPTGAETFLTDIPEKIRAGTDEPYTDIFLFSDGRNTSGARPAGFGAGTRVHAILIGKKQNDYNAGIGEIHAPDYGFTGEKINVAGYVYAVGVPDGESVGIELFDGGERVDQGKVTVNGRSEVRLPFSLNFTPQTSGLRAISARVKLSGGETVLDDNERTVFIDIVTEKRSMLYIDSPGWESRFLKPYLAGVEKLKANTIMLGPGSIYTGEDIRNTLGSAAGLEKYRIIIIGDAGAYLTERERESLAEYTKRGGQTVTLGGMRSLFTVGGEWGSTLGALDKGASAGSKEGFEVTPTADGWTSDLLRLADNGAENRRIWKSLPFAQTFYRAAPPAGSLILAAHPWLRCAGGPCPLIFSRQWNQGRVLAISFEGLWRWKLREKETDSQVYDRLWKNIFENMLESERRSALTLRLSARTITLGEKVTATARVSPETFNKSNAATLSVKPPQGALENITMTPVPGRAGFFSVDYTPGSAGRYSFAAEAAGRRSDAEPMAAQVSPAEFRWVSPNGNFLRDFAALNGGAYSDERGAARIAKQAVKNREYRTVRLKRSLLTYPILLFVLAALLSAEWIIRRRGGLS